MTMETVRLAIFAVTYALDGERAQIRVSCPSDKGEAGSVCGSVSPGITRQELRENPAPTPVLPMNRRY